MIGWSLLRVYKPAPRISVVTSWRLIIKSLSLRTRHQSQVYHGVNEELQGSLPPRESTGLAENGTRRFHESSYQHSHLIIKGGRNGQGWVGDREWRRARLSCLPSELEAEWTFFFNVWGVNPSGVEPQVLILMAFCPSCYYVLKKILLKPEKISRDSISWIWATPC